MKKFISLVLALVMALSLTTVAWGADVNVGTGQSLADAITTAGADGTVTLTGDVEVTALVNITEDVTINLNGHKLSRDNGGSVVMVKNNATLTILGTTTGSTFYGRINLGEATNNNGNLVIDGGTYSCADGQTVLHVNGTCLDSDASIYDAAITSPTDNAIQFNGAGTFVIDNCVITGATGIYMKAGTLSVTNTTVTANGAKVAPTPNGDGSNTTGDALVMDTMTGYAGDMKVTLGAGNTFTSANGYAIQESNTANAASSAVISLVITNGSYTGAAGAIEATDEFDDAVEAGTITASISGGTFSTDVSDYVADGSSAVVSGGKLVVSVGNTGSTNSYDDDDVTIIAKDGSKVAIADGAKVVMTQESKKTVNGKFASLVPAHFTYNGVKYVVCHEASATHVVTVKGVKYYTCAFNGVVPSVEKDGGVLYTAPKEATCGKVGVNEDKYVVIDNVYYLLSDSGTNYALVGGKMVVYSNTTGTMQEHVYDAVKSELKYNTDRTVATFKCAVCNNTIPVVAKKPNFATNYTAITLGNEGIYYYVSNTTGTTVSGGTTTGGTVNSADTFDAGIAMYVGMSVMAAAGSAVVLKKKD